MKRILFFLALLLPCVMNAQRDSTAAAGPKPGGIFMLGMRTTSSLFTHGSNPGLGLGGQFRIRLTPRINTDWFADYITNDLEGLGKRTDYHIGWSVLFYLYEPESQRKIATQLDTRVYMKKQQRRVIPYILAGHCFDYTLMANNSITHPETAERWSSAIQGGAGVHFPIKKVGDLSFTSQYMMHLGTDIHGEVMTENGPVYSKWMTFHEDEGGSLEGHLLLTLSLNVRIADLWSR